ncbi:MAG: SDR family oxidoreductase [Gammaproteobacteria bacterium]
MKLDLELEGKSVLVTGASGGIGLGVVEAFLTAGAHVSATDKDISILRSNLVVEPGHELFSVEKDISDVKSCRKLVAEVIDHFGRLDILVNCAALIKRVDLEEVDEELWDQHMDINLKAVFFLSKYASEDMRKRNWGRIINLSSQAGHTGGARDCVAYAATKGGINTLTKSFAKHLSSYGITVNSVSPGLVNTRMITGTLTEESIRQLIEQVPIKRLSEVEEIALPVIFLASQWASSITGLTLDTNGGMLMR